MNEKLIRLINVYIDRGFIMPGYGRDEDDICCNSYYTHHSDDCETLSLIAGLVEDGFRKPHRDKIDVWHRSKTTGTQIEATYSEGYWTSSYPRLSKDDVFKTLDELVEKCDTIEGYPKTENRKILVSYEYIDNNFTENLNRK